MRDDIIAICNSPGIRDKERLIIGHAILALARDWGDGDADFMPKALYFTTDPVTCDRLCGTRINEQRAKASITPAAICTGVDPNHTAWGTCNGFDHLLIPAETAGLGVNSLAGLSTVQNVMPPAVLTYLYIAPQDVARGGTGQFTAVGKNQYDDAASYSDTVDWSVSGGGTISSTGLFTSDSTVGHFTITATLHANPAIKGTFVLKVPGLTSLAILPVTYAFPGTTAQVVTQGLDQDGAPFASGAVDWSVTGGGAIDATGLFTSNGAKGTFTIRATVHASPSIYAESALFISDTAFIHGVRYEYFVLGLAAFCYLTSQAPNQSGTDANFDVSVVPDRKCYAFRFTGLINVPADGSYTFYSIGDWADQVWIDDVLVINNDIPHSTNTEQSGVKTLSKGLHLIKVLQYAGWVGGSISVSWQGPGFAKQAIPDNVLYYCNDGPSVLCETPDNHIPKAAELALASPNPFARTTQIKFSLPSGQRVAVQIYDVSGRLVKTLVNGHINAGTHTADFNGRADNGRALVNGTYFCRMQAKGFEKTVKLLLVK
jgi:hypothetical protein